MMETDADRLASIQALGGISVRTSSGREFHAVADSPYQQSDLGRPVAVEGRASHLMCRSSDVSDLAKDEPLSVEGHADLFRVRRTEPDVPAPGWTTVHLRR